MNIPDIIALLPDEIAKLLTDWGEPPYRGVQIFEWIHGKRASSFDEMTNLPKSLRRLLAEKFRISCLTPVSVTTSADGTKKLLFDSDGRFNAVLMPQPDRVTLCVSSQVGCRMGCAFCLTGRLPYKRSLQAHEIIGQVLAASRLLPEGSRITNVVFMGMGEPLDNLEEVIRAIRVITHRRGLRVARSRTTVSTVGLLPRIREFMLAGTGARLALSLCATEDTVRASVVPAVKRYPLSATAETLRSLPLPHGHRYTIEYLLIPGIGASLDDARRLSRWLSNFPSKVNLIPFNPWPGAPFSRPSPEMVEAFARVLEEKNHIVTIRWSRGVDIGAACGQLDGSLGGA